MWEKLNELMKIPGLMEVKRSYGDNDAELKKLGFPDITFDSDIALAECQCAKHIEAHALTTKVAEVEASVRVAEESMAMKTQFAAEAVQAEVENEQKIYKLEDAVRALKKEKELHIQLKTDTASTDKNLVKTQDDLEKAKAAMAQCSAKVQKCNDECRAAKSTLSGLQFDLEHAVEKADKFRAQVPDTCELFHTMEVPAFCQNECGFSGGKAELAIHSRSCNYKGHVCDADDCDFKDTFANVEAHEKECAKYKKLQRALKTGMGAYTTPVYTISPPVSYYSAPMAYPAAPVSYGTQVVPITGTPSTITGTPSTVAQPTGKQI